MADNKVRIDQIADTAVPPVNRLAWLPIQDGNRTRKVTIETVAKAVTKNDVGLGNVDNTSDEDKPIGTATQEALNLRVPVNVASGFSDSQTLLGRENIDIYTGFATRADLVSKPFPRALRAGTVVAAGGSLYVRTPGATAIPDLTGWLPFGDVTPEHFGAVGDCILSGTTFVSGTDDLPAFQSAINYTRRVFLPRAEVVYRLDGSLSLPRFQSIVGYSIANSDSGSLVGAPKLAFTGSGTHCMGSADSMSTHSKICGFVLIDTNATKAYDYLMNFKQCIEMAFEDIKMETKAFGTHGLRCYKDNLSDISWSNRLSNVKVRLADASVVDGAGRTLDLNWSDSTALDCQFTGGIGSIDRGIDVRYIGCQFERSFFAGMTSTKTEDAKRSCFIGCNFDGNWQVGLRYETDLDVSTRYYVGSVVSGCAFRTLDPVIGTPGIANIQLVNSRDEVYMAPIIGLNEFQPGTPTRLLKQGLWSSAKMVGNSATTFNTQNFDIETDDLYVETTGIKVPRGPVVARGAASLYNETGSAFFGGLATNVAGVVLGHDGSNPFIGTTTNGPGASTDSNLAVRLNGDELLRFTSDRLYVRPAVDGELNLGTPGNRFNTVYATTGTINTSDERLKRDIEGVPDAVLDAWADVEWAQFRLVNGQRLHVGLIAQRVREAFEARGLDATEYGLLCYDQWDDTYEEVITSVPNEDGTIATKTEQVLVKEAGDMWSIRYEEALAMEAALMRRELNRLRF